MRSNSRIAQVVVWLLAAAAAGTIALVQPPLADDFAGLKRKTDVFALPSPQQTVVASLGYRAALADLIFAHVRVSQGIHFQEDRLFEFVGEYLDTVSTLDPKFRTPYLYGDALYIFQPTAVPPGWYRRARTYLEKGLEHRPDDAELFLNAGQFTAFLAPSNLPPNEDASEWRAAGAKMLARACDVMGNLENLPYHCITATTLFGRVGERDAAIRHLRRILAISDDPEIRRRALSYLRQQLDAHEAERYRRRAEALRDRQMAERPSLSRAAYQVVGPDWEPADCAGHRVPDESGECATSFRGLFDEGN